MRPLPSSSCVALGLALLLGCGDAPKAKGPAGAPSGPGSQTAEAPAPLACGVGALPPRQLRLLTRHEYANTVEALFSDLAAAHAGASGDAAPACADDTDCDLHRQSCEDAVCVDLPCDTYRFSYAGAAGAVVVAGSFNGWATTTASGGWPLAWDASLGLWGGSFVLPEGTSRYKLVIDGSTWLTDPSNPDREPDGYGGENNLIFIDCSESGSESGAGTTGGWRDVDPLADFPVEGRPEHYAFDNSAEAGLVTATHLDQYMQAAEVLAAVLQDEHEQLLGCDPTSPACAVASLDLLLPAAFRRPLTPVERSFFVDIANRSGFGVAVRVALASPHFLYRSELGEDRGDGVYALTDHELASALSYALTAAPPDALLRADADAGALRTVAALQAHVQRLLATPAAQAQLARFGGQWLGTERLATATRQASMYPDFTAQQRADLSAEAGQTFAWATTTGGLSLPDLFTGRQVWVTPSTASLYGLAEVEAPGMVEVPEARAGLLGWASVLAAPSHSDQTSPVRRGLFVRTTLLCQQLGPPPPEAGGVPDVDPEATTRERFAQHSSDPACAGCHQYIDPIGFGLEDYDAVGAWRPADNGLPIDSSGLLTDVEGFGTGTSEAFSGPAALGALLADADAPARCAATAVLAYGSGRVAGPDAACAIDAMTDDLAAEGHRLDALWRALVASDSFRFRRPAEDDR